MVLLKQSASQIQLSKQMEVMHSYLVKYMKRKVVDCLTRRVNFFFFFLYTFQARLASSSESDFGQTLLLIFLKNFYKFFS